LYEQLIVPGLPPPGQCGRMKSGENPRHAAATLRADKRNLIAGCASYVVIFCQFNQKILL
jgi:hypothetical protein